jgi:hypothetical protein
LHLVNSSCTIGLRIRNFLFASRRVTLFCLSKSKVTKQKDTPYRLFPALLSYMGGNRKLTSFKQPLAESSPKLALLGAVAGWEVKIVKFTVECSLQKSFKLRHSERSEEPIRWNYFHKNWILRYAQNDMGSNLLLNFGINCLSACICGLSRLE